jgi:hypothetical protein
MGAPLSDGVLLRALMALCCLVLANVDDSRPAVRLGWRLAGLGWFVASLVCWWKTA